MLVHLARRYRSAASFLFCLPLGASLSPQSLPKLPLGFETAGTGFRADTFGGRIQIERGAAAVHRGASQLRIVIAGSSQQSTLQARGVAGTRNEMIGNDRSLWRSGIPLFSEIRQRNVYRGIDLVWHGDSRQLEYDFQVAPHAGAGQIDIRIQGAARVRLNPAGDLVAVTASGEWIQHRPTSYQTIAGRRHAVESAFLLNGNHVHLALGPYDHSLPLTIDPAVTFSSYFGGTGNEEAHAIAVDTAGDLFIAGFTTSTPNLNSHVLLVEIPASGTPVSDIFGGSAGTDIANGLAVDSLGDVFLAGSTTSPDFPITSTLSIQSSVFGGQKAFVIAFPPGIAKLQWSAYFGGSDYDEAFGIALGPNDLLYIVGDTDSPDFLNSTLGGSLIGLTAYQDSNHGGYDAFLVSIATGGAFNFATYMGGTGDDHAYAVTVGTDSTVYVVGATDSTDFVDSQAIADDSAFQTALSGGVDAFAIAIATDPSTEGTWALWSTYLGGTGSDSANAVALDSSNNLYIAGSTSSADFPVTTSSVQNTYQGGESDGFVFALNENGLTGKWSTYLGTAGDDFLNGIALDAAGNIYVTGTTDSTAYPVTSNAPQSANAGDQDVTVTELNSTGASIVFSTYLGGSGNDVGRAIAVDTAGDIFVDGVTSSSNFPVTANGSQLTYGGSSDAFVTVLGCSASAAPSVSTGGVTNAGSFLATAIAPGGIISIFGSNFSCTAASASSVPLTTTLSGVTVQVNGSNLPLFYVGASQINAQLPYGTATGTATVTVTTANGVSNSASFTVQAAAPGIFLAGGQAAALNQDYSLNTTANGAAAGSVVTVFFTGQGALDNPVADGAAAPDSPLSRATLPGSATIGGQPATVDFLGLAPGFVGLAQANLTVPNLAAGSYPVVITIGGVSSQAANVAVSN